MAGGPGTPELAAAVTNSGGLGFIGAGYKSATKLSEHIGLLRNLTSGHFGVNLFVPGPDDADRDSIRTYQQRLRTLGRELGAELGDPVWTDDDWEAKLALLHSDPVPVVSFTFGCPPPVVVDRLHDVGTVVLATVTATGEAVRADSAGVDALCVQGCEAGGHQASFDDTDERDTPLLQLLDSVQARTSLPLVAAGGVATPAHVRTVLDAGAVAAQLGTAFLRTPESGANPAHKDALVDPGYTRTTVTRGFSGRRARALVNSFVTEYGEHAPAAYPHVHYLTAPLRAAARQAGDPELINLWAGTGHEFAEARSATEIMASIEQNR